jgi:tryptophan synthase alpha chain
MKNRIDQLFSRQEKEILSIYITAGYPELHDTVRLLHALQDQGVHMVEIGFPFSDPLADGPVIQESSQIALRNGMTLKLLFQELMDIRKAIHMPLVLMGYLNPVLQMGMEVFLTKCRDTGIDGVILPDLPPDEYEENYAAMFRQYGIHLILLVTPHSGEDRIRRIASLSGGYLYMVAEASTTGARDAVREHQLAYFRRLQGMNLPVPGLIGFGISNRETFLSACEYARGAIIGSAFISAIGAQNAGTLEERVESFVRGIQGR